MPVRKPERDRSKPLGQQVTKEYLCDECGEVIMRKFMTGPRQGTEIAPPRWVTRRKQVASSRPGTYEAYMCTPCVNELVPEENQAHNVVSPSER